MNKLFETIVVVFFLITITINCNAQQKKLDNIVKRYLVSIKAEGAVDTTILDLNVKYFGKWVNRNDVYSETINNHNYLEMLSDSFVARKVTSSLYKIIFFKDCKEKSDWLLDDHYILLDSQKEFKITEVSDLALDLVDSIYNNTRRIDNEFPFIKQGESEVLSSIDKFDYKIILWYDSTVSPTEVTPICDFQKTAGFFLKRNPYLSLYSEKDKKLLYNYPLFKSGYKPNEDLQLALPLIVRKGKYITYSNINRCSDSYGIPILFDFKDINLDGKENEFFIYISGIEGDLCKNYIMLFEVDFKKGTIHNYKYYEAKSSSFYIPETILDRKNKINVKKKKIAIERKTSSGIEKVIYKINNKKKTISLIH